MLAHSYIVELLLAANSKRFFKGPNIIQKPNIKTGLIGDTSICRVRFGHKLAIHQFDNTKSHPPGQSRINRIFTGDDQQIAAMLRLPRAHLGSLDAGTYQSRPRLLNRDSFHGFIVVDFR